MSDATATIPCPFCGKAARATLCPGCGRDPSAPRKVCPGCGKMTPTVEAQCVHCGSIIRSDLWWKVPVIFALFAVATILAVVLGMLE